MIRKLRDHLFLFDIDGTILNSAGAGKKAYIKAFEILFNVTIAEEVNFLGSIDFAIFRDLYESFTLPEKEFKKKWREFKKIYLGFLQEASLESSQNNNWNIIPGADRAVKLLSGCSNIALVTGNIKKGAYVKLKKFRLEKYFKCGGFGDKLLSRNEVVKEAVLSSQKFYKKKFNRNRIYLFGDTKKDIDSANENSIQPVLIDPHDTHKDSAMNWTLRFRGSFLNIEEFLEEITY
jgi:phosphoglycolate phosphatase